MYCIRLNGKLMEGIFPSKNAASQHIQKMRQRGVKGDFLIGLPVLNEKPFYREFTFVSKQRAYQTIRNPNAVRKRRIYFLCETCLNRRVIRDGGICSRCKASA